MRLAALCLLVCSAAAGAGPASPAYTITTVAGGTYCGDGLAAAAAYLGSPEGLAAGADGSLYISDVLDHRVRRIDASSAVSTVAGDGYGGFRGDGGPAQAARLNAPYGLASDAQGNLYIADLGNARVRKVTPGGLILTVAGGGSDAPGSGADAVSVRLNQPRNVAVDAAGNLYISDFGDHVVYRVTPSGAIERIVGTGSPGALPDDAVLPADAAPLRAPAGLALDASGALYVADSGNGRLRKIQGGLMSTVATPGLSLGLPTGIAFDANGALYVADKTSAFVAKLAPWLATVVVGDGTAGYSGDWGPAGAAQLTAPRDIAFDAAGNLYIADSHPAGLYPVGMVRRVSPGGIIETWAGGSNFRPPGDFGPALRAHIENPSGVAIAGDGVLYVSDRMGRRLRKVDAGQITTLAGPGELGQLAGLALGREGDLLIADAGGSRIWRVGPAGSIARAAGLEGDASAGYSGDGDPALDARLNVPEGVAAGNAGVLYIADTGNHAIREVLASGLILTIAGTGEPGYAGDGRPASAALLRSPAGVAVDAAGNVYVADTGNHAVRKIDLLGMIATVAGTGAPGFSGDGGPAAEARLQAPAHLALDADGNLYIADTGNHRIRRVAPDGTITTIAGAGTPGFSGDGGAALAAELNEPAGVAVGSSRNLFIADRANNRVRRLQPSAVAPPAGQPFVVNGASFEPGPIAPGEIVSILGSGLGPPAGVVAAPGDTTAGGTQALFNGVPAPLFYAQDSRIAAQVPYEVLGLTTVEVEIRRGGATAARFLTPVVDSAPGIFTFDGGVGQVAALNADGTPNSAAHPARSGEVVTLFATGQGDSRLALLLNVGGLWADILSAAAIPGYAGLFEINVRIPQPVSPGMQPVQLMAGFGKSQAGATIAIR